MHSRTPQSLGSNFAGAHLPKLRRPHIESARGQTVNISPAAPSSDPHATAIMADAQQNGASDIVKEHSILPQLIKNLDRHLVFPLLNFLEEQTPEDEDITDITKLKFALLKQTNMTDFVGDLDAQINGKEEKPEEYVQKREQVLAQRQKYEEETQKVLDLLADSEVVGNLRSDKESNMRYLKDNHGVTAQMVEQVYEYGQFEYSCGDYNHAADLLYQYRVLSTDNDRVNSATWGKLACDILTTNWESAMEEVAKVKESIETRLFNNPLAQLQHRTWLIHWSLFPFFNHEPARETLTDLFFSQPYINTIQTSCPWILRYLAAAVITNRARPGGKTNFIHGNYQKQLKDLVRVVRQEGYEYSDPVTGFLKALNIDFDFEEAQKRLSEADEILRSDFFLVATSDSFLDAARHLISESYCKIHQRIDIKQVLLYYCRTHLRF
jgi:translation initiation factor 3 subunit E